MIRIGPVRWSRGLGRIRLPWGWEIRLKAAGRRSEGFRDEEARPLPGRVYEIALQGHGRYIALGLEVVL